MDAHITLLKELTALGKELGYRGADLNEWVTAQMELAEVRAKAEQEASLLRAQEEEERAERYRKAEEQREEKKRKAEEAAIRRAREEEEREEQRRKAEEEREERREAREEKRRRDEQQLEYEQMQLKLQMKKVELEVDMAKSEAGSSHGNDDEHSEHDETFELRQSPRKSGPKLPFFDETKDDIDSYLRRFERYSQLQKWPKADWAFYLGALLKGRSLDCYSRLAEADARDYDKLKAALLRRFDLTAEGFRKKFYQAKRDQDETAAQYVVRLTAYLERWIQLAEVEQSYEGLKSLLVRERFLDSCDDKLALYLRERSVKGLDQVVTLADHYIDARMTRFCGKEHPVYNQKKFRQQSHGNSSSAQKSEGRTEIKSDNNKRGNKQSNMEERVCYSCGQPGHIRRNCKQRPVGTGRDGHHESAAVCALVNMGYGDGQPRSCKHDPVDGGGVQLSCGCELPYAGCLTVKPDIEDGKKHLDVVQGRVGDQMVSCLRDTGCTTGVVRSSLVKPSERTGRRKCFRMLDGTLRQAETAVIRLQSPIYSGELECLCVASPICDVIIGNVPGIKDSTEARSELANAVITRAQSRAQGKPLKPLLTPLLSDLHVSVADMGQMQRESEDLGRMFQLERTGETVPSGKGNTVKFVLKRGLLHRIFTNSMGTETKQLVVPQPLRKGALGLAHESVMAGHLGTSKTIDRLLSQFWWPGIGADTTRFVRSCDACQRTAPKGRVAKAPLQKMPVIGVPFQRVGIDLVGPITPPSTSGNRFILCVVDYATRYPEAVALPGVSTEQVAEALCRIFSRVGVPRQILSDQGSQFVSEVMKEVYRLLSIQHITSTPYHPQANGLVEKFNGTLKSMVKKLCLERPSDWDRYLEPALFAYREVKQDSIGFSPFELLYGRTVRGPMAILRELWSKDIPDDEVQSTYQYVFELRNRMEQTCQFVEESLSKAQVKAKKHFDRKARQRKLKVGDKVLILRPTDSHKMLMTWKGPYTVTECIGLTDYRIQLESGTKVFHINLLKQYFDRDSVVEEAVESDSHTMPRDASAESTVVDITAGLLEEDEDDPLQLFLPSCPTAAGGVEEVNVCPDLLPAQQHELRQLLYTYSDIFSNSPGQTDVIEHNILLTDSNPIRSKTYPVPYSLREVIKEELAEMVKLGVVEPSDSPYSSPMLLVKKKDGTNRPVIDYRGLNRVTIFDAEPMPRPDDIYARLSDARFYSKLDFCKGYWQIPVAESDRPKTAFATPFGLYQFRQMPFGLQNAGATYGRMMRKVLNGLEATDNFVDDVLTFTGGWQGHLAELQELFERVRRAGLTVKPSKCYFGYPNIEFLGHVVGEGKLQMVDNKVEQIRSACEPRTKKQIRAFLGLTGYYRKFINDYARMAAPLTDALKGGKSASMKWGSSQEAAFQSLKEHLCAKPILRLPVMDRPFILRTDASDIAVGAVLLQEHDDGVFPVAYASRKLTRAECNYAVVERECLAIVWAVSKFYTYLYGRQFVLQTDHRPLVYLDRAKLSNARITRWALALQPFKYRTESIKGRDNVGADYLSRVDHP